MGYRDDRNAQRLRTEQLEADLAEAHRELAALREAGQGSGTEAVAAKDKLGGEPRSQPGIGLGIGLGVALVLLGVAAPMLTPFPPVVAAGPLLGSVGLILVAVGLMLVAVGLMHVALGRLVTIARPCEALVVAGRRHRLPDGTVSHLSVQVGGRVLRKPLVETVSTLDLRVMPVAVQVSQARCRDGAGAEVTATALVKVASEPARLRNAVERFLSLPPGQILNVAQQTLEGVLREVVSRLSLEELDEERLKTAELVAAHADDEMGKLGLELVGFWLMAIGDDERRLELRRRKALAEAIRAAELAEQAR